MPIYEYRCENGHQFEVIQRMTDDPVSECVTCAEPVEKIFHPIAVHFKGKGFYNTDYGTRSRQRENAAAAAEKSSKDKEKSSNDKSSSGGEKSSSSDSGSSSDSNSSSAKSKSGKSGDSKPVAAKG